MADFCKQCSMEHFGEDLKDLANLGSTPLTKEELSNGIGFTVLCEGCGFIIVDNDGKCMDPTCEKHKSKTGK